MDHATAVNSLITGTSPYKNDEVTQAIAARFEQIKGTPAFAERPGDYCYDGNRCASENLGWRFRQSYGDPSQEGLDSGEWDAALAAVYADAASSEHYYRFEKQW